MQPERPGNAGFSLLEVLAAMVVLALLGGSSLRLLTANRTGEPHWEVEVGELASVRNHLCLFESSTPMGFVRREEGGWERYDLGWLPGEGGAGIRVWRKRQVDGSILYEKQSTDGSWAAYAVEPGEWTLWGDDAP